MTTKTETTGRRLLCAGKINKATGERTNVFNAEAVLNQLPDFINLAETTEASIHEVGEKKGAMTI